MANANEVKVLQKDITDTVISRLNELEGEGLKLPTNYNPTNALKQAFFKINQVALSYKEGGGLFVEKYGNTPEGKASIANSLLDMVQQGLNPGKNQCYFVAYGNKLSMNRSYFGTQTVLKRLDSVKDIYAEVVRKGDTFVTGVNEDYQTVVKEFNTAFENMDNEIIGAFAIIVKKDGTKDYTIMTKKQIEQSWSKAKTDKVQKEFPEEMAKRTVINRAAKNWINTSDDSDLLVEQFNKTTADEYDYNRQDEPDEEVTSTKEHLLNKIKKAEPIVEEEPVQKQEEQPGQVEEPTQEVEEETKEPEEPKEEKKSVSRRKKKEEEPPAEEPTEAVKEEPVEKQPEPVTEEPDEAIQEGLPLEFVGNQEPNFQREDDVEYDDEDDYPF